MSVKSLLAAGGIAATMLLSGCETPIPPGAERGPHNTIAYDVLVEASSPGARIRADGTDLGNTPVHLKIYGDPDGTFHDFGKYGYEIRALPLTTNQFPQIRVFQTGHLMTPEDRIPERVYFDMNKKMEVYPLPGPPIYGYPPPYYYGPGYYYGPPRYDYDWPFYGPSFYGPSFRFYIGPGYHHGHHHHGW